MSDCFVLYLLLTCMKKKTSGADKFTNNNKRSSGKDRTWNPAYSGNAAPGNKKCIRDYL